MDRDTTGDLLQSLFVLSATVEARDPHTGGHFWRVSQYSRLLGERIGLPPAALGVVAVGGFLHDLGKIAVPDAVLGKRGPLTGDERAVVQAHPGIGAGLVARHPLGPLVIDAVRHHHERIDGNGYPDRLRGGEIPSEARIVSIADAFDAITSTRPYRAAMPVEHALGTIHDEGGRQFDGELAEAFVEIPGAGPSTTSWRTVSRASLSSPAPCAGRSSSSRGATRPGAPSSAPPAERSSASPATRANAERSRRAGRERQPSACPAWTTTSWRSSRRTSDRCSTRVTGPRAARGALPAPGSEVIE